MSDHCSLRAGEIRLGSIHVYIYTTPALLVHLNHGAPDVTRAGSTRSFSRASKGGCGQRLKVALKKRKATHKPESVEASKLDD